MTTIIGLCGSLRRGSFNGMLLRAAIEMAPSGTAIEPESIREIPLYDADLEEEHGMPPAVERLKNRIAQADGLLIVTPEYNNSVPGVLKNAIDWLSRPGDDIARVFRGRPVAIMGATTGVGGTFPSRCASESLHASRSRQLVQHVDDRAFRQLDLEAVVRKPVRVHEFRLGRLPEGVGRRARTCQHPFCVVGAPRHHRPLSPRPH